MAYLDQHEVPVVVKADGLAQGKGVVVATTRKEAKQAVHDSMEHAVFGQAGQRSVGREITPECDEIEIRCIEHQFDADQDKNAVAPRKSAGQADAENQRRKQQIIMQRSHEGFCFFSAAAGFGSRMAMMTAPMVAPVRSKPMASRGRM